MGEALSRCVILCFLAILIAAEVSPVNISFRQFLYLTLAATGLCVTWYFNFRFMAETGAGFDLVAFVKGGYANSAATSLSNDLLVGCATFLVFSFIEARRLGMRHWWAWPVLTFGVAFAFAFPLFLFFRDRRLGEPG
jgi:hypothetical protein